MRIRTQEEGFDYRMRGILGEVLSSLEKSAEDLSPEEFDKLLWDNLEELGQRVYESMFEWTSPEDWLEILKEK